MAGGTYIFDMIKRLKENENLKRMSYFKSKGNVKSDHLELLTDHTIASEEERLRIRETAVRENKKEIEKGITIAAISLLIGLIMLFVLLFIKF